MNNPPTLHEENDAIYEILMDIVKKYRTENMVQGDPQETALLSQNDLQKQPLSEEGELS